MKVLLALMAPALALLPSYASAQTTTYHYDALGRLVRVDTTVNGAPVGTNIDYDAAGNRTKYRVAGAPSSGSDPGSNAGVPSTKRFVVVPLNGFTLIPIN